MSPRLPLVFVVVSAFSAFAACHSARAAESARVMSPSVDIEVEDRAPGGQSHVARFHVSVSSGRGVVKVHDGDAEYAVAANAFDDRDQRKIGLQIKRHDRAPAAELEVEGAVPQAPGPPVIVAKLDRADGRTTTIAARAR